MYAINHLKIHISYKNHLRKEAKRCIENDSANMEIVYIATHYTYNISVLKITYIATHFTYNIFVLEIVYISTHHTYNIFVFKYYHFVYIPRQWLRAARSVQLLEFNSRWCCKKCYALPCQQTQRNLLRIPG